MREEAVCREARREGICEEGLCEEGRREEAVREEGVSAAPGRCP